MSKYTANHQNVPPVLTQSLAAVMCSVPDHRSDQGKRHALGLILSVVLLGFIKGKVSIAAIACFGKAKQRLFGKWFEVSHGMPCETTISRALSVTHLEDVVQAVNTFFTRVEGVVIEAGLSLDGKTIRAISHLKDGCHHFLSLFSHSTHQIIDQEAVQAKENEIPATPRLLGRHCLLGSMVTGDALLTQTKITQAIVECGADYLLMVKGNHLGLQDIFQATFHDPLTHVTERSFQATRKTRVVTTTIGLTTDLDANELRERGWCDIAQVGHITRKGTRCHKGNETCMNERVYFITSRRDLTPHQAYQFIRNHWQIENNLHWQKDVTLREDRSRAKRGNTPGILSYLRSVALSCIKKQYQSVTKAIDEFTEYPARYLQLLKTVHLV